MDKPKMTDDGYEIIEPIKVRRGVQCGICGMRFEDNRAYGYYCPNQECPVFPKIT